MQTTTGAYTYTGQGAVLVALCACGVVDVGQRVEFVHHDVDIVAADAVALTGNALAFVCSSDGVELPALHFALYAVEVVGYGVHACGVTYEHYAVGQLFRTQMQMET